MPILNYTTSISATKTANEVQTMLARHGAVSVSLVYEQFEPRGIAFAIETQFGLRNFQLPANAEGVLNVLHKQYEERKIERRYDSPEQAQKVAWRILKDWIAAQLALIESGMASLDEVMLPYMLTDAGITVTQAYRSMPAMRRALEGTRPSHSS